GRCLASLNRKRRRNLEAGRQAFDFEINLAVEFIFSRSNCCEFLAAARVDRTILLDQLHREVWPRRPHGELILVSVATQPTHVRYATQVVACGRRDELNAGIAAPLP